jgi:glycosyltransferase 2 family protein
MKASQLLPRLLGILILVALLYSIDLKEVVAVFSEIDLLPLMFAIFLLLPMMGLRALRWRYALRCLDIRLSAKDALLYHFASNFIGLVTPGRIGEMVKVYYIKAISRFRDSFVSVLLDRIFDLAFLFLIALAGIWILPVPSGVLIAGLIISAVIITLSLVFMQNILDMAGKLVSRISGRAIPRQRLAETWQRYRPGHYIAMSLYTIASYGIYYLIYYLAAESIDIEISVAYLIACLSMTSIVTFLPISFLGIGTRDISLVFLFGLAGISSADALAYSALLLLISIASATIGFVAWLARPISLPVSGQHSGRP